MLSLTERFDTKVWGESYNKSGHIVFGFPHPEGNVWPYLGGYIGLRKVLKPRGVAEFSNHTLSTSETATALLAVLSQIPSIFGSIRASQKLYKAMLNAVVRFVLAFALPTSLI